MSISLFISLSLTLSLSLSIHLYTSIHLSLYLSIHPSIYLKGSNDARLPKGRNSPRLPQKMDVHSSKTKKFFETFEINNMKNKAILRNFLQNWKVECRAGGLVPIPFAMFPLHRCACQEKVRPGHTKCCTCHAKSS